MYRSFDEWKLRIFLKHKILLLGIVWQSGMLDGNDLSNELHLFRRSAWVDYPVFLDVFLTTGSAAHPVNRKAHAHLITQGFNHLRHPDRLVMVSIPCVAHMDDRVAACPVGDPRSLHAKKNPAGAG